MLLLALVLAADAPLSIAIAHEARLAHAALLARADVRELTFRIPGVAAPARLAAIPLRELIPSLPAGTDAVDVACADGFVAVLPRNAVENGDPGRPIAYLAVERDRNPFPTLKGQRLGPYMVVWAEPDGQSVPRELWPYQVTRISASAPLGQRYPRLLPAASPEALPERGRAVAGFNVFVQNCLPCHPLNGEGPARVGPDLNLPHSPVEYLGPARLGAYVRDPQSLHAWPAARMPPFPASVLSDAQLADLLAYLGERSAAR
jgi:mono/diheme cytochrome c family protein